MELGEWIGGWIIENLDNRGLDNRGSTVPIFNNISETMEPTNFYYISL